jgi:hypothetical protein
VKKHDLELVGLADAAKAIDTTTRQMLSWSRREDFPKPVAKLRTPCWHRADVIRWHNQHAAELTAAQSK